MLVNASSAGLRAPATPEDQEWLPRGLVDHCDQATPPEAVYRSDLIDEQETSMRPGFATGPLQAFFRIAATTAVGLAAAAQVHGQQISERGVLPRGTTYAIRMPARWNRVLISDLDFAQAPDAPRYVAMLEAGYAISGTARRADRPTHYDPAREIDDLVNVMDRVEARFGKPRRIVQYGHSGGGHVALAMAEMRSDRIDGAVSGCAHTPVWLMNSELDAWFALKALIAPTLAIVDLPADLGGLTAAWKDALSKAQGTPLGRARIALAVTLGQLAGWVGTASPEPKPGDVAALQLTMFEALQQGALQPTGQSRRMFEQGGLGQLSWNTGIDYAQVFEVHADPQHRAAVRQLYAQADARVEDDISAINAAPRVSAEPRALKFWSAPGRTVVGEPKVPVLRIHTHGDKAVPVSLVQGYDATIAAKRYETNYRSAYVKAPGHCTFSAGESLAAIETVMRRIDKGQWGSTAHEDMNALAKGLAPSSEARFFDYRPFTYHRVWIAGPGEHLMGK